METMNDNYDVIVSEKAANMLVYHAAFLARVSVVAANRLVVSFEKATQSLKQMPQRCPWFNSEYIPKNMYRQFLFEKRYLILYQIQDNTVYIDYVIDCRQDYEWMVK